MFSHLWNKDNNTSLPHRGVVGVLVLYRALRMQSVTCQVLLFCSHQNQFCAGFHDIVIFKSQIQVTDLTSPNIDYTSLLTTFHKLTTRNNTDLRRHNKKRALMDSCCIYAYDLMLYRKCKAENKTLLKFSTRLLLLLYHCTLFTAHWLFLVSWELSNGQQGIIRIRS